ncbi:MAG: MarR family transcriptional regulator [Frankiaceae bacterium]
MIEPTGRPRRTAFLLAQLGSLGASRFADQVGTLGLTPGEAGVLRLLGRTPGISQRALAGRLGAVPSRVVVLVDSLEQRDLVARRRSQTDRRNYELHLTDKGTAALRDLRGVAEAHERTLLAPLDDAERKQLRVLLGKLAAGHELDPEVHRGHAAM